MGLYWQIGGDISAKLASAECGEGVVENLAQHLGRLLPGQRGFPAQNLWRMRQFHDACSADAKLSAVLRDMPGAASDAVFKDASAVEFLGRPAGHGEAEIDLDAVHADLVVAGESGRTRLAQPSRRAVVLACLMHSPLLDPRRRHSWRCGAALLLLALAGCGSLPSAPPLADDAGCQAWLAQLDDAVASARVADAEAERIAGFAGLRVDRTGMALRDQARQGDAAFAAWLQRAAALDEAARAAEIANLPDAAFPLGLTSRAAAQAHTQDCRHRRVQQLLAPEAQPLRQALLQRATLPARYSTAGRALGLYPLVRWPFFAGVQGWQSEHLADMARWAAQQPLLQRYGPAGAGPASEGPAREGPASEGPPPWPPEPDALGLPQPTAAHAAQLLAWHAPVFEIERLGSADRFGAVTWGEAAAPQVDAAAPVVYQRVSHTRLGGRWLLQLSYTLWFPERPARSAFDLLAGALDGVVLRLTLDEHGQPLLVDTIHACGCYHLFFPAATLRAREGASPYEEWLFAPAPLPPLAPTQRLVVRLASATHYVMGLHTLPRAAAAAHSYTYTYTLRPEDALRSLPAPGGRRSLYGPDGLVAGTERGERFLFWPMGIASAGAMRQWGHHATAFVGRRHFDDADLIDRRFERIPP